jgi:hypothetical protein
MSVTEETYEGVAIVVDETDDLAVSIDGTGVEVQVDDHGPKTLYSHRDVFESFEDPMDLAKLLVDREVAP